MKKLRLTLLDGEELTGSEFAGRIAQAYSLDNPRTKAVIAGLEGA